MIASVSGVWVFRVIVCYLMVNILGLGLFGAWLTMVMDQYLRAAISCCAIVPASGSPTSSAAWKGGRRKRRSKPSRNKTKSRVEGPLPRGFFSAVPAGWKARPFARGKLEGAAQQNRAAGKPPAKPGAFLRTLWA